MRKFITLISSPLALLWIAAPPAVWFVILVYGYDLSPQEATGAVSFRVYYTVMMVITGGAIVRFVGGRKYGEGLMIAGLFVILLHGAFLHGFRMAARAELGEGETLGRYSHIDAGPWATDEPPAFTLTTVRTDRDKTKSCAVLLGREERILNEGSAVQWNDFIVTTDSISFAPLFILRNAKGEELEGGYFKVNLGGKDQEFFQFRVLPHRFYVSLPGAPRDLWRREGNAWIRAAANSQNRDSANKKNESIASGGVPAKLHIRIMRGKLTLFAKEVSKGAWIDFDGHRVSYSDGAPWVAFTVRRVPSHTLLYIGLGAVLAGVALKLRRRRAQ